MVEMIQVRLECQRATPTLPAASASVADRQPDTVIESAVTCFQPSAARLELVVSCLNHLTAHHAPSSARNQQAAAQPPQGSFCASLPCPYASCGPGEHASSPIPGEGYEGPVIREEDVRWVCRGQAEREDLYRLLKKPQA